MCFISREMDHERRLTQLEKRLDRLEELLISASGANDSNVESKVVASSSRTAVGHVAAPRVQNPFTTVYTENNVNIVVKQSQLVHLKPLVESVISISKCVKRTRPRPNPVYIFMFFASSPRIDIPKAVLDVSQGNDSLAVVFYVGRDPTVLNPGDNSLFTEVVTIKLDDSFRNIDLKSSELPRQIEKFCTTIK